MTTVEKQETSAAEVNSVVWANRPAELDNITVGYDNDEKRFVDCFCGERVSRSIVPHMKADHESTWDDWCRLFVDMRGEGLNLKQIMVRFADSQDRLLFSWSVIGREIPKAVSRLGLEFAPPPVTRDIVWNPENFEEETKSVWSFPRRGNWAVHDSDYRGNWPPQLVRNLLLKYTKPGDFVVDAFMGGGTTLIESWLLGRKSLGIDLSGVAIGTTSSRLDEFENAANISPPPEYSAEFRPQVIEANSTRIGELSISTGTVNLLCAHPPYLDTVLYSDHQDDLSRIAEPTRFYERILLFANSARPLLSKSGVLAFLIGDVRVKGQLEPLGLRCLNQFTNAGFQLQNLIIKTQHNDRSTEFYRGGKQIDYALGHEYLLILTLKQQ